MYLAKSQLKKITRLVGSILSMNSDVDTTLNHECPYFKRMLVIAELTVGDLLNLYRLRKSVSLK